MSTQPRPTAPQAQAKTKPPVIRTAPGQANGTEGGARLIPAWIISVAAHAVILTLFVVASLLNFSRANAPAPDVTTVQETKVEDDTDTKDLTNPDIGIDPSVPLNYNVDRIEDVSV